MERAGRTAKIRYGAARTTRSGAPSLLPPSARDEPAGQRVSGQHADGRRDEQQPGMTGRIGDEERFAAYDQPVGHPQCEIDIAAGGTGPQARVDPPGIADRWPPSGPRRPPGQAEPGGCRPAGIEGRADQQSSPGGQRGDEYATGREPADLHGANGHVEDRTAEQVIRPCDDLVEQPVADRAGQGCDQAQAGDDREGSPDRHTGDGQDRGTSREDQGQTAQRRARRQSVRRRQHRARAYHLRERRAEYRQRGQQR